MKFQMFQRLMSKIYFSPKFISYLNVIMALTGVINQQNACMFERHCMYRDFSLMKQARLKMSSNQKRLSYSCKV